MIIIFLQKISSTPDWVVYAPIIAALVGAFASSMLAYFFFGRNTLKALHLQRDMSRKNIAEGLKIELFYIKEEITRSYNFTIGFFKKIPNSVITQEKIDESIVRTGGDLDKENLEILASIRLAVKNLSFDSFLVFKNINKEIYFFEINDSSQILTFYYYLHGINSQINDPSIFNYSLPLTKSQSDSLKEFIESYIDKNLIIIEKVDNLLKMLDKYP